MFVLAYSRCEYQKDYAPFEQCVHAILEVEDGIDDDVLLEMVRKDKSLGELIESQIIKAWRGELLKWHYDRNDRLSPRPVFWNKIQPYQIKRIDNLRDIYNWHIPESKRQWSPEAKKRNRAKRIKERCKKQYGMFWEEYYNQRIQEEGL